MYTTELSKTATIQSLEDPALLDLPQHREQLRCGYLVNLITADEREHIAL